MYRNLAFINSGAWALNSIVSGTLSYQYYIYHKPIIEVNQNSRYITLKNHNCINAPLKIEQIIFYPNDFEVDGNPYVKDVSYFKRNYTERGIVPKACKICYKETLFGRLVCDIVPVV
jgi:hypothetical protein